MTLDNEQDQEIESQERESILIVEDDQDLRAYLKNSLQATYQIVEAENGVEGVEKTKKHLPDLIISDVMMPEMDGIEMCKTIKENHETSHIPILMVTAKTDIEHVKVGLEAGAWDYIKKPFNNQELRQKINNILKTRNKFRRFLLSQNISIEVKQHYTSYDQNLILRISKIVEEKY